MASLVGVHGVYNYRAATDPATAAQQLAAIWQHALLSGPLGSAIAGIPFYVAYYAHLLREPAHQAGDVRSIEDLPYEVETMVRAWLDTWKLDPGIPQGIATMPLRQAIGMLANRLKAAPAVVETFAAMFFPEAEQYLRGNTPHRTLVRAEVATAIAAAAQPRIVLAHSLGSVITYEALNAYPHIEVELLVTLGSPLAMPVAVFDRLDPSPNEGYGRRPTCVQRWINVSDKGDLIAIPRGGVKTFFQGVGDDLETSVHPADFHTVSNYLKTETLADVLRPYLSTLSAPDLGT